MKYKKCPICDLNYIPEDEDKCSVCSGSNSNKSNYNREPLRRTTNKPYIFMVYQGKTFEKEFNGGYIEAPANSSNHHWERLLDLKKGDYILHAYKQQVIAFSTAEGPAYTVNNDKLIECHRVNCHYVLLDKPLNLNLFKDEILQYGQHTYSPFNKNGTGNQGYLFLLSHELGDIFVNNILKSFRD